MIVFAVRRAAGALALAGTLACGAAAAGPTATILSATSGRLVYGEPVTFAARVTGAGPTGTVTFLDGARILGGGVVKRFGAQASLAAGDSHTCALTPAGAAWCWGRNDVGQLGDGTTTDSETPVPVSGLSSGVVAIAAGDLFTCALTAAGAVKCWGYNFYGQLGNGTVSESHVPVQVAGLASGVAAIVAGDNFACAMTRTGGVKCWGDNGGGNLGNGTVELRRTTPVDVVGLSSGVVALAAGQLHTCAVTAAGGVLCWGQNNAGQIGDGTTTGRTTPAQVAGLSSGVAAIAAGGGFSCAATGAGAAFCWGFGGFGNLGNGTIHERHVPVAVSGLSSGVVAITAGDKHTCAATAAGAAFCWGSNDDGQIGDGSTSERRTPVAVSGLGSGVVAVDAGDAHSCALTVAGAVLCWGFNSKGQLGDGTTNEKDVPTGVTGFGAGTAMVSGRAAFSTSTLPVGTLAVGTHAITARYNGDANNSVSTSAPLAIVVDKGETATAITVKPKKPKAGKAVRFKVAVTAVAPAQGKPAGKVTLRDGKKKLGKVKVKNGKAGLRLSKGLRAGKRKLKAQYSGDGNWNKSNGKLTVRVSE